MLDIIFLSFDEPNAAENFANLKARFPHAQHVRGVKGIANAHIEAAKRANTTFFYVVDADAEILDNFKFDYKPTQHEAAYVHVWKAFNPATGMSYGYGGVKLFSKKFFNSVTSQLDFTTTLTKDIKVMEEVACVTRFNSDHLRAFRGAFRESVKLYVTVNKKSVSSEIRNEARERLAAWIDPLSSCDFSTYVADGARFGISEASKRSLEDLMYINDPHLVASSIQELYPELDLTTSPKPKPENKMKHELFFTTRIAGALYDPFVLENVKMEELRDALSDGQLLSKNWLVAILAQLIKEEKIKCENNKPLKIAILGGWIGTLSLMIFSHELPISITSIDLDERSNRVAEKINYGFDFCTMTQDMYDVDYSKYDVIINTSSEHIPDIPKWRASIGSGKICIVQNNNYTEAEGHVSTVDNSQQLRKMLKLTEVLYEGTRVFPQYSRFMLIGRT